MKKGQKFFQRPQTRPQLHLLKFCNFFALCGPFWHKNSADRSDLSLKAIKAKKANIRPNDSKLDFRIFRGLAMVPQHAKRSYKVPWRPVWIRFWETTTPEPKIGPAGQKISSDKKLIKIKKNSLVKYLQLWFSSTFCEVKFFDPPDPFLVLESSFLKRVSRLAFKALYKTY